ncbi:MAG: conjugal transfer protein TraI [Alphaproteobacteria bacterium]|nr:MAG: conjugal transfer protein TraI [Alphaproteobacteria bacterium]
MHYLRYRVFRRRLEWPVSNFSCMEHDQFDTEDAVYIVHIDEKDNVDACTRLLPTTKPNLLADVYPHLVDGEVPKADDIWETTRFCADYETAPANITGLLVAAMLEYGIQLGLRHYVSVSDIRIEPLLRRAGWNPQRLGEPQPTGTDTAAAEIFEVSEDALAKVRMRSKIPKQLLNDTPIYHLAPVYSDLRAAA